MCVFQDYDSWRHHMVTHGQYFWLVGATNTVATLGIVWKCVQISFCGFTSFGLATQEKALVLH